jgi:hypothetical protein
VSSKRKPLVYIAGPYTHPDPIENTHRHIQLGMRLVETGLAAVEIPHLSLLAHLVDPHPVDYWYAFDLDKLAHCHFLYRAIGESTGADNEVARAIELVIPVFYQERGEWNALLEALAVWMTP